MNCPICDGKLTPSWENSRRYWFAGVFTCGQCGPIRISGTKREDGGRFVELYLPVCPCGAPDEVTLDTVDSKRFSCWACGRRFEIRGRKLITTQKPAADVTYLPPTWYGEVSA